MFALEYYWRGGKSWYEYGKKFDTIDEAKSIAYPWYSDGPHKFRIKNSNGEIVWEKG